METNTHFEKKKGVIAFYIKLYFSTSKPQEFYLYPISVTINYKY